MFHHQMAIDASDISTASENLAHNIKQVRETLGRSQQQMAERAGIPRPTWSTLERGDGNPTLAVLLKVAAALQVSLEELVAPPRSAARLIRRGELRVRRRGQVRVEDLLPEPVPSMQIERMVFEPGGAMRGAPHTPGTREYLLCERGVVELTASGQSWTLQEGDVLVFRGDQKHGYRNPRRTAAVAVSIVALAPG